MFTPAVLNFIEHLGANISMTVGQETIVAFNPTDPISRADAVLEVFTLKMAALDRGYEEQVAEISKAAIPDVVKAAQLRAALEAKLELGDQVIKDAWAEIDEIKKMPQPPKGHVAVPTRKQSVAA